MTTECEGGEQNVSKEAGTGLNAGQFRQLAKNGIGDPSNAYVHGMEWFEGRLYCGMTRNSFKLLKLFPPIDPPALDPWVVDVPPSVEDLDMQGQIWRWTPETDSWEMAYRSPLIPGKHGKPAPRDLGYRGARVFQGINDEKPNLYVSTMSTVLRGCAAHVLRSEDGINFEPACEPGIGNDNISTFRELVSFDGYLYAPPAGEGIQFNSNRTGVIKRSNDPRPGNWEVAMDLGFGDPTNNGVFMMTTANNQLYAGTFNNYEGYQVWTTPPCGDGPLQWRKVIDKGAYRGPLSEIAMGMVEFNGALYVGSSIQNGGYDRTNLVGPAAGEIIRIWPDDSWDLLVGLPRDTPDGMKYPLSGIGPGFDNIFSGYTWRMCVHDGWLYVTTFDWSVFLQYAHRPSPTAKKLVGAHSFEQMAEVGGGFEMWRTKDGVNWMPVTINGMNNPYNYGGRTMVSTPKGLAVGTANVFGGKSPARFASRWQYVENPDGGTEIFLGDPSHRAYTLPKPAKVRDDGVKVDIATTGATGYIGKHLVPHLLDAGYTVRSLTLPGTAKDIDPHPNHEVIEGFLEDDAVLDKLVDGAEKVLHMAARLGGSCAVEPLRETNVHGTHQLLRACNRSNVLKRFIFSSSVAAYQNQFNEKEWPIHESHPVRVDGGQDLADYGMTKVAGENLLRFYGRKHGYEHSILRFALVYGIGDPLVDLMVREQASNADFGEGQGSEQPRQFVHIDDAVESILRACFQDEAANETFNVAGPDVITYKDIGRMTRIAVGKPKKEDLDPDRKRVWRRYQQQYDISKGKTHLGFRPSIPFAEGLRQIIEVVQDEGKLPRPAANQPLVFEGANDMLVPEFGGTKTDKDKDSEQPIQA
ncbi:NAD-dependent dehydratase [Actibacterium mucosum KCTC 23349]|uniref:NAD-dependent dehydratase n=1 Tax=Actibacterium mucosum KCTC 23349 TaxID=1454373 RepID=A0A037ZKU9_9RHOB|nr:NAD(P)-dependent oxidoreductase [Actibacterium mucosum]KAJ55416.1 NAD-dependent dehydratase [Actibacterium mucosum KCTC 23349]